MNMSNITIYNDDNDNKMLIFLFLRLLLLLRSETLPNVCAYVYIYI